MIPNLRCSAFCRIAAKAFTAFRSAIVAISSPVSLACLDQRAYSFEIPLPDKRFDEIRPDAQNFDLVPKNPAPVGDKIRN